MLARCDSSLGLKGIITYKVHIQSQLDVIVAYVSRVGLLIYNIYIISSLLPRILLVLYSRVVFS